MRLDPGDLRFEQRDTLGQLVLGIWRKIFSRELARGVSLGAGKINVIHCYQHRKTGRLLSMCESGIRSTGETSGGLCATLASKQG